MKDLMTRIHKAIAARKISGLSEEQAAKVLAFMEELEAQPAGNTKGSFAASGNGGNGMRKIALRGMIGRKRDTILLWTVIVLAFLFLALPTTLITSLNATDAAQRVENYGRWQVMAAGLDTAGAEKVAALAENSVVTPVIEVSGMDYFQGDNTYALGVYTPELAELGSFQLREGHWPEAEDEIVLEYARLASLGLKVGDTFKIQEDVVLHASEEYLKALPAKHAEEWAAAREAAQREMYDSVWENCMNIFLSGDWEIYYNSWDPNEGGYTIVRNTDMLRAGDFVFNSGPYLFIDYRNYEPQANGAGFFLWWWTHYMYYVDLFIDEEHPDGVLCPLEEMTEEQFATALRWFLLNVYMTDYLVDPAGPVRIGDLLGTEDLTMRLDFSDDVENGDTDMTLTTFGDFTVCGVIDTYTDHWDSGRLTLPGGFLSQAGYQRLRNARQAVLDKYPQYEDAGYETIALLMDADGSAAGLRAEAVPEYNAALAAGDAGGWLTASLQIRACSVGETTPYGSGSVTMYNYFLYQIDFDFLLADEENCQLLPAKGWLVPSQSHVFPYGSYYTANLLDESVADAVWSNSQISLAELRELEDDTIYVRSSGGLGGGETYHLPIDLDTAAVAIDWAGERYEVPFADFMAADFQVVGMSSASPSYAFSGSTAQDGFAGLRTNTLAYPSSAESNGTMLMIVMGILFVTTVCAVFQICFTQIRRRMRRVVLMKSLGAETRQIAGLMCWEFLYFWATALPIGTALGLGGAWLAATVLSRTQDRTVLLTIEPGVLVLALLAGTLALAIGMMIPAVMAAGVPLTGRTVRRKPMVPPKKDVRQDFFHVSLRGLAAKKGRTIGSVALCAFMMTITVLCLFLGFRFLGEYRDTVVRDGKPDYRLHSAYAMGARQRREYLEELDALGVCGKVTSYFVGEDIGLGGEGLEESVLFFIAAGDGTSCPVTLYTTSSEDDLFAAFQSAATVGQLDAKAFDSGKQILLAIPLYRDTGKVNTTALATAEGWDRLAASGIETTFLPEFDGVFQRDEAVQVGDTIRLATTTARIMEDDAIFTDQMAEVTVGAILYYFPDTGIWPLSGSGEGYQVVASLNLLRTLLPSSGSGLQEQSVRALYLRQTASPLLDGVYGATDFYIDTAEGVDQEAADTALLVFARKHYMDIEVYHESSTALLRNAVSNILLACLLGMSAVLLALVIFYNTVSSDIEQERPRIGILQSLGVSNGRFAARQAAIGGVASAIAVVVANVLLWGGVILFVCATGTVLGNLLWGYPTAWHVCLCAALACILISLFVLPMGRVGRYLPVENIRSKN